MGCLQEGLLLAGEGEPREVLGGGGGAHRNGRGAGERRVRGDDGARRGLRELVLGEQAEDLVRGGLEGGAPADDGRLQRGVDDALLEGVLGDVAPVTVGRYEEAARDLEARPGHVAQRAAFPTDTLERVLLRVERHDSGGGCGSGSRGADAADAGVDELDATTGVGVPARGGRH